MATKTIQILYFAALRERIDRHRETIDIDTDDIHTLADVWDLVVERHPELDGLRDQLRVAVGRQIAEWDDSVADLDGGAEIVFIPPVSGGSVSGDPTSADTDTDEPSEPKPDMTLETRADGAIAVTPHELDAGELESFVRRPSAGGLVTFEGIVRNHTDGRPVEHLVYEAYTPMAADVLADIRNRATDRWPEIELAVHHRVGTLDVGQTAVVVTAASAHRAASFEAVQWTIRTLKMDVPIWKKEVGPSGEEWIGFEPSTPRRSS